MAKFHCINKSKNIDIKQGNSLFIGIKTTKNNNWAKVYYADLWGKRENKFEQLQKGNLNFLEIVPDKKQAYLIPFADNAEYEQGISIIDLFPLRVSGVKTSNDNVAIAPTREELTRRLDIVKNAIDDKPINELFGKFTRDQTAEKIQNDLLFNNGEITTIDYRPFDIRWTYYSGKSGGWMDRPREKKYIGQLLQEPTTPIGKNIGLCFTRTDKSQETYSMVFVSDKIVETCYLTTQTAGRAYVAPLYLHSPQTIHGDQWTSNLNPEAVAILTQNLTNEVPTPIQIFDYTYATLHNPTYRQTYNEFLKRDYPRIPIIKDQQTFDIYTKAGERLRKLHLLQEKTPAKLTLDPPTSDNLEITNIKYKDEILHINPNKCILGIPQNVYNYRIGGYNVIDKWLKSHKGKTLTIDDFEHISNITGLIYRNNKNTR